MAASTVPRPLLQGLNRSDFDIHSFDDEIRVEQLCVGLLRHLYQHLVQEEKVEPEQASKACHGADYFLREFVVPVLRINMFDVNALQVRQFAGHWYIIRTVEPNLIELQELLSGTAICYNFLADQGLIDPTRAGQINLESQRLDYFQQRIDDFWAISGDGYDSWRQACPLTVTAEPA